ncbi:MAG TPA: DMT family transporter [Poseidonia sp.]|nr:DMT family transporter [Poseidonia sp.]
MKNAKVHAKLLIVAAIWGLGWPAGRIVAAEVTPILAAWIRYIIVAILFILYLRQNEKWFYPSPTQWKKITSIAFFSTFLYQAMFMYGMKYTAAGDASLVITFNPLFTAILAVLFLGERFTLRLVTGLSLALIGMLVIFTASPNTDIPEIERWVGNAFIAGAAMAWAASSVLMKKLMSETPEDAKEPLTPVLVTVWASLVGLLLLTPWASYEVWREGISNPSFNAWAGIVFLAVFSTVLAYVWFADGIHIIGAGKASFYVYLVPPFGILGGWLLLGEQLGPTLLIAFALIVSGVAIAQKQEDENEQAS